MSVALLVYLEVKAKIIMPELYPVRTIFVMLCFFPLFFFVWMSPLKSQKIYLENMSQRLVKEVGGYSGEE